MEKLTTQIDELQAVIDIEKVQRFLTDFEYSNLINPQSVGYFPDFLKEKLNSFLAKYSSDLLPYIEGNPNEFTIRYKQGCKNPVLENIKILSTGILSAVNLYYQGKILKATQTFNQALDEVKLSALLVNIPDIYNPEVILYRTRESLERGLSKKELFHIPFENRHLIKTNRYSIPGLPALYLGSSVYVCWEEYNRPPLHTLYFSKFKPKRELKLIEFNRPNHFSGQLFPLLETHSRLGSQSFVETNINAAKLALKYLSILPLIIACTFRTKEPNGSFKPEYIIPQLLLQYVAEREDIDGIKYPSTKVDYINSTMNGEERQYAFTSVSSYNYVFPVKEIKESGYCQKLLELFEMTEPTSIEIEDIVNHSEIPATASPTNFKPSGTLMLVKGIGIPYESTKLGNLEWIINSRPTGNIE